MLCEPGTKRSKPDVKMPEERERGRAGEGGGLTLDKMRVQGVVYGASCLLNCAGCALQSKSERTSIVTSMACLDWHSTETVHESDSGTSTERVCASIVASMVLLGLSRNTVTVSSRCP